MKKIIVYTSIILLLTIIIVGTTYAYLVTTTNSSTGAVSGTSSELNVVYSPGKPFDGMISLSEDKSGGLSTTVNISITEDSVQANANLFIKLEKFSSSLASSGFIWEVYKNDDTKPFSTGTFEYCQTGETQKKCAEKDKLYIVSDYPLSTTNTEFTVYVWLNGDIVGNEVINAEFQGSISAETSKFTGTLK